jgi:hypothetical protein
MMYFFDSKSKFLGNEENVKEFMDKGQIKF